MALVTDDTHSCSRAFVIPSLNMERLLPESGIVVVDLPAQQPGKVLNYSCSMGMYTGQIAFE